MHDKAQMTNLEHLRNLSHSVKALFWDMDGTLVNTEILHAKSIFELTKGLNPQFKLSLKEVEHLITGITDKKVFDIFFEKKYLDGISYESYLEKKDEIFFKMLNESNQNEILAPEIKEILDEFENKNIQLVLVTSSEKKVVDIILGSLNLKKYFDHIITREDTKENKPSPEPYLLAIKKVELNKDQALIIEDSDIGIAAANASGIAHIRANWY